MSNSLAEASGSGTTSFNPTTGALNQASEQGLDNKTLAWGMKVLSKAQQERSRLYMHCRKEDLTGIGAKFVELVDTQETAQKARGADELTKWKKQGSTRVRLDAALHYVAIRENLDERGTTQSDKIETGLKQGDYAIGRSMDKELLTAIACPSFVTVDSKAGDTAASVTTRYRHNLFANTGSANAALTFTSNDIARVRKIFRRRDIHSDICCTLTNELANILEVDEKFTDREQIYSGMSDVEKRDGFVYRGVKFIQVSDTVLPLLGTGNLALAGQTASANVADQVEAPARSLNASDTKVIESDSAVNTVSTINTAGGTGTQTAEINVAPRDIVYFWQPDTLCLGERSTMIIERGQLPNHTFSQFGFIGFQFGACVIDPARTLMVAVAGTTKTALA